jgi:trigger factor
VEEPSLPEVDEEFCRAYGVEQGGLAEMRREVRDSMERELAEVIRNRLRVQALDALYKENPIDVPRALIDEQVQQLQIDTARRLGVRDVNQLPAREAFVEPARRRVALGLLVGHIVQSQGLKPDRARVQARLDELVVSQPNAEEARRAYLQNAEAMHQLESGALEDQVVDWVLERARISERPSSFSELTGFNRQQPGHEHEPSGPQPAQQAQADST